MVDIRPLVKGRPAFSDGRDGGMHRVAFAAAADGLEALANGLNHSVGHGFASFAVQLLSKLVGFGVFDVKAHESQNSVYLSTTLCGLNAESRSSWNERAK